MSMGWEHNLLISYNKQTMAPLLLMILTIILSSLFLFAAFKSLGRRRRRRRHGLPLPPGPKGWPILGFLPKLGPNPHQIFHRLSKTYGPLLHLRIGVTDVVVPCSAAAAEKLLRNDMKFINRPKNSGAEHIAYNYQDIGFLPYGPRWRMQRKLCALHLFSAKALDDFQHGRRAEFTRLVRRLLAQSDTGNKEEGVVDIGREVAPCVGNSLSLLLLGRRVFDEDPEVEAELRSMVMELMALTGSFCMADFLPGLGWLDPQGLISRMKKLNRKFDEFLNMFIAEHRRAALALAETSAVEDAAQCCPKDLLTVLLQLQEMDEDEEGAKLTDIDIKALLMSLYAAGSDSNSILAEWGLAELIRNPMILKRAQAEVDSVVGRERLVSESDLPNLPLLHAVVKEILRLHPPAPLSLPRVAVEDCQIDGYLIPKGTTLLLNIWAIGRDPTVWPDDPLDFRPDRFLPGGLHEGADLKGACFGLLPFGTGRRMCVGMNLGLRMLTLVTATMAHSFDWHLPSGQKPETLAMEEKSNGLSLLRANPLLARPVPRLATEAYFTDSL